MAYAVETYELHLNTRGKTHIIDITSQLAEQLQQSGFSEGALLVSASGSTAGVTTVEFEPGLVDHDLPALFEQLAPYHTPYEHNKTWGDDNGAAHLRASLLGGSYTIPFREEQLILGTWQQVVYIDFDTRPRKRTVILQFSGLK